MAARKKKPSSAQKKANAKGHRSSKPQATKQRAKAAKPAGVKAGGVKSTGSAKASGAAKGAKPGGAKASGGATLKAKAKPAASKKRPATSRPKPPLAKAAVKKKPAAPAKPTVDREKVRREKEREKAKLEKERENAKLEKEREKAKLEKEREKVKLEKEREKAKLEKEREKVKLEKERERTKLEKEREKERLQKEREKEREKERLRKQKEAERDRALKGRETQRIAAKKAREEESKRRKEEREAEKVRKIEERERLRLELIRKKEEERKQRDAEREAYNKAKETERAKLRAQKEAARRALEGKVARATKRANRIGGMGRGATARVYSPASIPNQSGTSRREAGLPESKFANLRLPDVKAGVVQPPAAPIPAAEEERPPPPPPPPPPEGVEERYRLILERMGNTSEHFRREYQENFDMSWIYHDSALEGVVYTYQELKTAIDPNITVVPDSSLQPVCEEIRRHKAAIDWIRELADKKRVPVNIDVIKRIYLLMHPEEGDLKSVKYRKDIPQHRLYFHEYAAPDKIAYKVRQAIDWLNGPEPKKLKNPVRIAARVHYDLLRVFPFPTDSGKVARLLMNLLLLRAGYPPAIVHSTERQRYYDALKGSLPTIVTMVSDSITNGLQSIEKLLDDYERKGA